MSTCVKCGGSRWEMVEPQIAKIDGKRNFIQCADCGGVAFTILCLPRHLGEADTGCSVPDG